MSSSNNSRTYMIKPSQIRQVGRTTTTPDLSRKSLVKKKSARVIHARVQKRGGRVLFATTSVSPRRSTFIPSPSLSLYPSVPYRSFHSSNGEKKKNSRPNGRTFFIIFNYRGAKRRWIPRRAIKLPLNRSFNSPHISPWTPSATIHFPTHRQIHPLSI